MPTKRSPIRKANYITKERLEKLSSKTPPAPPPDPPASPSPVSEEPDKIPNRALSVRQPYAEQILRGTKKIEYRNKPTHIRGRVYLYASLGPAWKGYARMGTKPGDFPTGVIVGTVEIVGCTDNGDEFEWHLANPERLAEPVKPDGHPQPAWFKPFKE